MKNISVLNVDRDEQTSSIVENFQLVDIAISSQRRLLSRRSESLDSQS